MNTTHVPWAILFWEFLGTALLLMIGLSVVIVDFGFGSPIVRGLPDPGLRRLITGFLFGTTGALIAISPVGKHSGAHLNPVVTLAFWLMGNMRTRLAAAYVVAQMAGAALGTLPLLVWGTMGKSVEFGATVPSAHFGNAAALLGELATTLALIVGLFVFLRHRRLRAFTPLLFPFLYAVMVYWEAPLSGTSTNPARSFGPALISGVWRGWWIYWIAPVLGTLLGVAVYRSTWLCRLEIEVAKLYHFGHDPRGLFGKRSRPAAKVEADKTRPDANLT